MTTNLLHAIESFTCNNLAINKSVELDNFILAQDNAIEDEANVYTTHTILNLEFDWGYFYELLYWTEEELINKVPWMTKTQQEFLMFAFNYRPTTPENSSNILELEREFNNDCNGLIGCDYNTKPINFVWNVESYQLFVFNFYKSHPELIAWQQNVILPNLKYSNQLIIQFIDNLNLDINFNTDEDKLTYFSEEYIRSLSPGAGNFREGFILDFCHKLLEANFYYLDAEQSECEKGKAGGNRRKIYKPLKKGIKYILSQDFENGNIELCDSKGNHLSAINYLGIKKEKAKTDHSLRCL